MPYYPIDFTYILFVLPTFVIALIAQMMVQSAFGRYSKVRSARGLTGAQAARDILDRSGLHDVRVEPVHGHLSDHYDPRSRTIRLSDSVYRADTVAAVGIAAHEAGHAIQHAERYTPMAIRHAIIPVTRIGSFLAWPVFVIGLIASIQPLLYLGILAVAAVVVFQLVTLPVEFNASRRALVTLERTGMLSDRELAGAKTVLRAAALTYLAALLAAIGQMLRLIALASGRRGNRR